MGPSEREPHPKREYPEKMLPEADVLTAREEIIEILGDALSAEDIETLRACADGVELFAFAYGYLLEVGIEPDEFFAERGLLI